jgi:hypothetical protein
MNNPTAPVHVVKTEEHLLCDLSYKATGHPCRLIALDETQQVLA